MGVKTGFRGQGIGKRLLETALHRAFRQGLERVELEVYRSNVSAVRLYQAHGFRPEGVKIGARKLDGMTDNLLLFATFNNAWWKLSGDRCASMATLIEILTAKAPDAPMVPQTLAHAVPGRGLLGDRYFGGTGTFSPHPQKPDFEVTLIQSEHIDAFAASSGLALSSHSARRNLVTTGIDLNALVGREFRVGPVTLRGMRLCEPCNYLAKLTAPEVLRGLLHKGGLRAQILSEGDIQVGDAIVELR